MFHDDIFLIQKGVNSNFNERQLIKLKEEMMVIQNNPINMFPGNRKPEIIYENIEDTLLKVTIKRNFPDLPWKGDI